MIEELVKAALTKQNNNFVKMLWSELTVIDSRDVKSYFK